ncbi:MAG: hypothetical protein ACREX0_15405 [Noviherbaspirillum sp.]
MATETFDPAFFEPAKTSTRPELLVSAVLHLMSHYTAASHETRACTKLASVIERHLKALADLPELAPVLRATCDQLSEQWGKLVEHAIQTPERPHRLLRFVTGTRAD